MEVEAGCSQDARPGGCLLDNNACKQAIQLPVLGDDLRPSGRNQGLRELAALPGLVRGFPCGICAG